MEHWKALESEYEIMDEDILFWEMDLRENEKSEATIERYLRDMKKLLAFLQEDRRVNKVLLLEWKKTLMEKYQVRTINAIFASVNSFFNFMGWNRLKLKSCRVQKSVYAEADRELTPAEYLRLLSAAKEKPRLYFAIETIAATGIRISELKYFTVESLEQDRIIVTNKNKTREILMPNKLRKRLKQYVEKEGIKSGPIFRTRSGKPVNRSNLWREIKELCRKAGVSEKKGFPHNLRKLFARTFYKKKKDIATLADLLGHSSIETTRIYIMTTDTEHLEEIEELGLVV